MGQLSKYSGCYAKVCAMKSNLLHDKDYTALLEKKSVLEIALYLKALPSYQGMLSKVSEENIHRGMLERVLERGCEADIQRLSRFFYDGAKQLVTIFVLRKETEILKQMMRMLESGVLSEFHPDTDSTFYAGFSFDPVSLKNAETLPELIENLKGSRFYRVLLPFAAEIGESGLFQQEMALDLYYYSTAWKIANAKLDRENKRLIKESLGSEIDALNLTWVVRAKRLYGVPNELIYSFLIPVYYKVTREQIMQLVEVDSEDTRQSLLAQTVYAPIFADGGKRMQQEKALFLLNKQLHLARNNPFSVMPVIVYQHRKENEVQNLTKIIEGVRYGITPEEIKQYLNIEGGGTLVH